MFLRKFIILNKQSNEDVKGHAKLEVRGTKARISLSLDGAGSEPHASYKLCIVSDESSGLKEVELGLVDLSGSGRGKLDIGFNSNSIDKDGGDIADFNTLILRRQDKESGASQVVLGGYIHRDDDSLSKIKNKKSVRRDINQNVEKAEVKDEILKSESEEPKELKEQQEPQKSQELKEEKKRTRRKSKTSRIRKR